MKLEEGMYVRLNCNYELGIGKTIREIDEDNFIKAKFKDDFECSVPMYMISKASNNIIDLIEEGDYINGSQVIRIEEHNEELYVYVQETEYCNACDEEENIYYKEDTIKSIVTKEQFESMEYKVGEE